MRLNGGCTNSFFFKEFEGWKDLSVNRSDWNMFHSSSRDNSRIHHATYGKNGVKAKQSYAQHDRVYTKAPPLLRLPNNSSAVCEIYIKIDSTVLVRIQCFYSLVSHILPKRLVFSLNFVVYISCCNRTKIWCHHLQHSVHHEPNIPYFSRTRGLY